MATPDLDQTLSLKASMDDGVTPALQKIDKGLKTTQDALNELTQKLQESGQKIGTSTEGMASKTTQATERLQKGLKDTGGAFSDLGDSAEKNSERVGQALKDSLYSRDASQRLSDLDKELGGLKSTFEGMASTARPTRGKAKSLQAIGKDSINKKIIPAFQELHATLDEFPDTLEDITRLQAKYTEQTGKFHGILGGVNERVEGFGGAVEKFKFTIQDLVGTLAATAVVIETQDLQRRQMEMGQVGGVEAFQSLPQIWAETLAQSKAPIELWNESLLRLTELGRVGEENLPALIGTFVEVNKATGVSVDGVTELHDKLSRIGGLKMDEFTDTLSKMKIMADEGRISMEALAQAVLGSAKDLRMLSQEARKAYAENVLTVTTGLEEMGVDSINTFEQFKEAVQNDQGFFTQVMIAMKDQGKTQEEAWEAFRAGDYTAMMGDYLSWVEKNAKRMLPEGAQEGLLAPHEKLSLAGTLGGLGVSNEMLGALRELMTPEKKAELGLGPEASMGDVWKAQYAAAQKKASAAAGGGDVIETQAELYRATIAEQKEQTVAIVEELRVQFATVMAPSVQEMANEARKLADFGVDKLIKWDKQYDGFFSQAFGFYSIATPVMTALRGALSLIPGMGGISTAMGTGVGGLVSAGLGALGLKKLFGGGEGAAEGITLSTGATLAGGEALEIQDAIKGLMPEGGFEKLTQGQVEGITQATGYSVEDIRKIMKSDLSEQKKSGFSVMEAFKGRLKRDTRAAGKMFDAVVPNFDLGKDLLSQYLGHKMKTTPEVIRGTMEAVIPGVSDAPELLTKYGKSRIEMQAKAAKLVAIEAIGGPGEVGRQMATMHQERVATLQAEMLAAQTVSTETLAAVRDTSAEGVEVQKEHKLVTEELLTKVVIATTEVRDELRKKQGSRKIELPGAQGEEDFLVKEAGKG